MEIAKYHNLYYLITPGLKFKLEPGLPSSVAFNKLDVFSSKLSAVNPPPAHSLTCEQDPASLPTHPFHLAPLPILLHRSGLMRCNK